MTSVESTNIGLARSNLVCSVSVISRKQVDLNTVLYLLCAGTVKTVTTVPEVARFVRMNRIVAPSKPSSLAQRNIAGGTMKKKQF
jgi:hypothetical protein